MRSCTILVLTTLLCGPTRVAAQVGAGAGAESAGAVEAGKNKAAVGSATRLDAQAEDAVPERRAAAEVGAAARERARAVRERAGRVSGKARASADAKLAAEAERVNGRAHADGEARVASRLAGEFGLTVALLEAERAALDARWGDLMIAHTLAASAGARSTVGELFALHESGMGWGSIAAGLGFDLGRTVRAVGAEARVAFGRSRADGEVAQLGDAGARAGLSAGVGSQAVPAGATVGGAVNAGAAGRLPRIRIP